MKTLIIGTLSALAIAGLIWTWTAGVDSSRLEAMQESDKSGWATATFAGGCFWCMEPPFDALEGVYETTSGYTGGRTVNPSYEQVSSGGTGHVEALQVRYDPEKVSYSKLLEVFWVNVNPTDPNGQFCDRGSQYATAIFYHTDEQKQLAEESKRELEESGILPKTVVTPIRPASTFYEAEDYHQDYYKRNPLRYKFYRTGCGRDSVLRDLWGETKP
jgi:methionine-S-sulfoxide reductase